MESREIDESLVWPVLARNGMMQAMSNSFLVVASTAPIPTDHRRPGPLAIAYASDRAMPYAIATEFLEAEGGGIRVEKRRLWATAAPPDGPLGHHPGGEAYRALRTLHSAILAEFKSGETPQAITLLRRWVSFVSPFPATPRAGVGWATVVSGEMFDCLPFNLLIDDAGELTRIDREWTYRGSLLVGPLVLRYLLSLACEPRISRALGVPAEHGARQEETIRRLLRDLGLRPTPGALEEFVRFLKTIDDQVFPGKRPYLPEKLAAVFDHPDREVGVVPPRWGRRWA